MSTEHRQSVRMPCDFPIRIVLKRRFIDGVLEDVSRTGLRMRVLATKLGARADADLVSLAHAASEILGPLFEVDLHYEMLGSLVRKRLRLVRLGQADAEPSQLALGCVFAVPLTDEETTMLGLGLPPVGVTEVVAIERIRGPIRRGHEDEDADPGLRRPRYQAVLHPAKDGAAEPLSGETLGPDGTEVVLSTSLEEASRFTCEDVAELTETLARTYGARPRLEILDGLRMVWEGHADIRHVETGVAADNRVHVHLRTLSVTVQSPAPRNGG